MLDPNLSLLHAALESPLGVEVSSTDPHRLRQKLYTLRREQAPLFQALSFVIIGNKLWIVKR